MYRYYCFALLFCFFLISCGSNQKEIPINICDKKAFNVYTFQDNWNSNKLDNPSLRYGFDFSKSNVTPPSPSTGTPYWVWMASFYPKGNENSAEGSITLYLDNDDCLREIFILSGSKNFHDNVRTEMLYKTLSAIDENPKSSDFGNLYDAVYTRRETYSSETAVLKRIMNGLYIELK